MWDLLQPGTEPVSLELAGGFFPTEQPEKPQGLEIINNFFCGVPYFHFPWALQIMKPSSEDSQASSHVDKSEVRLIFFFNWRIIALQNCVVFCQTSSWISHRYTYVPSLLTLPPISHPLQYHKVDTEPLSFMRHTANSRWLQTNYYSLAGNMLYLSGNFQYA